MSIQYSVCCPGFLWNIPALPRLKIGGHRPPATLHGRLVYAEFGNHPPMPHPDRVRPGPSPHQSDWTGCRWEHFGCGADVMGCGCAAAAPQRCTGGEVTPW